MNPFTLLLVPVSVNVLDILILVSLVQGLVLGFAIWRGNLFGGLANRHLAAFLFMVSVIGLNIWLSGWNLDEEYYAIDLLGDDFPWILLFYVPLYRYFLLETDHPFYHSKHFRWLYVPYFVFLLLNLFINGQVDLGWYELPWMVPFQMAVYAVETLTALIFTHVLAGLAYPLIWRRDVAPEKQNWLKRIWRLTALLLLSWFVITYNPPSWDPYATYVFWSLVAAFIYWLTWEGIYQFRLARLQPAGVSADLPAPEPPPVPPPIPTPPKAVIPSGPSPYLEKLDELIQKEEIHRRPDLSREWVAEQLDISPGYLSQLINRSTGQNFSSYINAHRVETVKRLLHDPDYAQFSVMAIGQEAGFSSKSAYYTAFKKATGMTPSAFQKQTE